MGKYIFPIIAVLFTVVEAIIHLCNKDFEFGIYWIIAAVVLTINCLMI